MQIGMVSMLAALLAASAVSGQDRTGTQGQDEKDAVLEAMQDELRARINRDDWLVTMEFRDARVQDIVEEFRRQVRVNIILDATDIPEDFRVSEFILKDVPFRTAFNAFLEKSQMMIDEETAALIRISHPPRITFNFKDANVRDVLDMIALIANANIVISPKIEGKISVTVHDVPWKEVLDSVVKTLNYTTVRENFGIIRVIRPEDLRKQMERKVFTLKYIQPPPVYTAKIDGGKFIHGKASQPPVTEEGRLKEFFLKPMLEAALTRDSLGNLQGRLDYEPRSNAFVVTDVKPVLDEIGEILKILDVEPAQVIIDLKFISTTNEDLLNFGTNFIFGTPPVDGISVRSTPQDPNTTAGGKLTRLPFGLGHESPAGSQFFLTEYDMQATFRAFQKDRYSKILQQPTITALDNEMATIFIGEEIHYAETRAEVGQFGGVQFSIGEAKNSPVRIGFQLFVLPRIIKESNRVLLTIIPQNEFLSGTTSELQGFERFKLPGAGPGGGDVEIDLPRVSKTTLVTKMLLESGKTAVIGGLVVERSTLEDKKVPLLGDIPIFGYFFKQTNDVIRKEHLLIFVTPRIVRLEADKDRIQAAIRQRSETLRRDFEGMRRREAGKRVKEQGEKKKEKDKKEFEKMKEGEDP